jgi:cytochrome c-type protein NapB
MVLASCGEDRKETVAVPGHPGAEKSSAGVRATRRAFDGAPPVIPHEPMGAQCVSCHTMEGLNLPGVGFAPPSPHARTRGMEGTTYCTQCHVWNVTDEVFRENTFVGLRQDLRQGKSAMPGSPPVIPHSIQMRENCMACHTGPAAREEIRCDHPERVQCRQCHVTKYVDTVFVR